MTPEGKPPKPVVWIRSSLEDLKEFPERAQKHIGQALLIAQFGGKSPEAKPLIGFGHAGILEIVEIHNSDAYRAVYTVRFDEAIYVLHVFQKKSTRGIATPRREVALIAERLKHAEQLHRQHVSPS